MKCRTCGKTLKKEDIGAKIHQRREGVYFYCKKCAKKLKDEEEKGRPEEYLEKLEKK